MLDFDKEQAAAKKVIEEFLPFDQVARRRISSSVFNYLDTHPSNKDAEVVSLGIKIVDQP